MATDFDNREQHMTMECDQCGNEDTHYDEFIECMEYFKRNGWLNRKIYEQWMNFCSGDCLNEYMGK